MKKEFSLKWVASKQPRKQRKYAAKAPLNTLKNFMRSMLSKELRKKYTKRNIGLRKGDTVKIITGQFKGVTGKVNKIWLKRKRVYVDSAVIKKKDGSNVFYPIHPSNLMITELYLEDKKRKEKLEKK